VLLSGHGGNEQNRTASYLNTLSYHLLHDIACTVESFYLHLSRSKRDGQKDGILIEKKAKRWLPFNCFLTVFFLKKYIFLSLFVGTNNSMVFRKKKLTLSISHYSGLVKEIKRDT
jgi:hypothetical protein